jgi:hypothetical protein
MDHHRTQMDERSSDSVTQQRDRILANAGFDASFRPRASLRFIVEETPAGRQEGLAHLPGEAAGRASRPYRPSARRRR